MKKLVITGGSSGIGASIASLLSESYEVHILDTQKPELDCNYIKTDVTDSESVKQAFKQIGNINALVHAAGIYIAKDLLEISDDEIELQIKVNLTGTALVNKYALQNISKQGVIINISSALGLVPEPSSPVYCATKAGTIMLTKALAQRYASKHIRVNAILPGPIDTPLLREEFSSKDEFNDYLKTNPMGRVGRPEEVAKLAEYLLSDNAKFITGSCIPIDGGESSSSLYSPNKK